MKINKNCRTQKNESEETMKNLFIIALLIITIYQNFTVTQLKKVQEDYINLQIRIEEGLL